MQYLQIPESTLRIIIGIFGGLLFATRLYGMVYPEKVKRMAGKLVLWKPGWIRLFCVIVSLFGLWLLYSTLIIIFQTIPVFMVFSFLFGLCLVVSSMFVSHPEWFPDILKGVIINRGSFFLRVICLVGLLAGAFILLSAIFGWRG